MKRQMFSAVVTLMETDEDTAEEVIRTKRVLKKGNSFGVSLLFAAETERKKNKYIITYLLAYVYIYCVSTLNETF